MSASAEDELPERQPTHRYRFRFGDAFRAEDPLASWATVAATAANDVLLVAGKGIRPGAPNFERAYFARLTAAHLWEAAKFFVATGRDWPEVRVFLKKLPPETIDDFRRIVAVYDDGKLPVRRAVLRARDNLFHYPEMERAQVVRGREEVTRALGLLQDEEGVVEVGPRFRDIRAWFADDVALTLVLDADPSDEEMATNAFLEGLREPVLALMRFTEAALGTYLEDALKAGLVTVEELPGV